MVVLDKARALVFAPERFVALPGSPGIDEPASIGSESGAATLPSDAALQDSPRSHANEDAISNEPRSGVTRLLVYSHDTFGLGNLQRSLKICEQLAAEIPQISILLLTGNVECHRFSMPPHMDFVKLPSILRQARNQYVARHLNTSFKAVRSMRRDLVFSTIKWFAPDIVLVDKAPIGVKGELQKSIRWLKKNKRQSKLILYLRDVLDDAPLVRRIWQQKRFREAIDRYYDAIWVFGSPIVCDMVKEYELPESIGRKMSYCGYIMPNPEMRDSREVRSELGIQSGRFVLVTGGGGGDAYKLMKNYLEGVERLRKSANGDPGAEIHSLLVLGPEMPVAERRRLQAQAGSGKVRIVDFTTELLNYMNSAELVVSMGGYNTVCEILSLRKRAIVVPRESPVNEQLLRTTRMEALGLVDMIRPEDLSPETMALKIEQALGNHGTLRPASEVLDTDGLSRVSRGVLNEVQTWVR